MSVSDLTYPGNASSRPREITSPLAGVALWWCGLEADDAALPAFTSWLSDAEHLRASRYGRPSLARRYIVGRANLRWILAHRLGVRPSEVSIERDRNGRPRLTEDETLDFNVSNTLGVALIGVTALPDTRIGVDLEHGARKVDHSGLARKYLTPRERSELAGLDETAHRRGFLRYWTCKEAMSKATGDALSAPLRRLDVALHPALRLVGGPAPYVPEAWTLAAVEGVGDYLATVSLWRRST